MADPNTRQGKRTPVTLKIKFKSETLEQFIERYAVDVSQGGIFIRTKEPLAVGTQMRFEFQLRDASPLIAGEGTVVWTRENDPSRPAIAPGMGVRFDRLAEGSQGVLERILLEKLKQAPQRPSTESTKPPMFTDTPTRVAPLPVQEALLGDRNRSDSSAFSDQGTPLPRPMPFHSDAEDFDEGAFEEATKVRALDELIAQTAGNHEQTPQTPLPEARGGRADSTVSDPPRADSLAEPAYKPPVDRDSAPVLPSPPEAAARAQPKLLDTTPSPRTETPALAPGETKTRLGVEPPAKSVRASTPPANVAKEAPANQPVRAVARDSAAKLPAAPESTKSSSAPLVILLLLLVAAGGAAVWFFVLRDKAVEEVATQGPTTNTGSDGAAVQTGSDGSAAVAVGSGSAGSAVGSGGSAGSAGSAAVVAPTGDLVDTVIASSVDKATVEVIGTPLTGPAPFMAKLEKGKDYKARVQAPGFAPLEVDVKGGDAKVTAKLVAKPRTIKVTSEPPGAAIFIDSMNTGKTTPFDVELTKTQSAKKSVRVMLQKRGFRSLERVVDTTKYTEDADKMIATLDEKLAVYVVTNTGGNTGGTKPNTGSGATNGSAGTTTGSGTTNGSAGTTTGSAGTTTGSAGTTTGSAGSAGTTTGSAGTGSGSTTPSPGSGSGSAAPTGTLKDGPKPGAGSGSATTPTTTPKPVEPEPDFMKRP